jgi:hypothetical protein
MTLDDFLEQMTTTPFVDGQCDCVLNVADWVLAVTGVDPAAGLRGTYDTVKGRNRVLRRQGGLRAAMAQGAARAGLQPTKTPVRGDVGLITKRHVVRQVPMAAIFMGRSWAVKSKDGLAAIEPDNVLDAWSVPHG